jgi:dipeptidyl aminopeptidase/acylaminoacyl peptidase
MDKFLYLLIVCELCFNNSSGQTKCDTLIFNSNGSNIYGYFYVSAEINSPTLIFIQAFFETGDIWNIGKTLAQNGINVFMFDFRGCFRSDGKQGLMNSQQDISTVLEFLTSKKMIRKYNIDTSNIIMGGYSYGGHMSMLYVVYHSKINRVISISGGDLGILGDLLKADTNLFHGYYGFFRSIKKPGGPVEFEYDKPINELLENQDYFYILKHTQELANTDVFMTGGLDDQTVSLEKMILPIYRALKKINNRKVKCNVYQTDHSYSNVRSKLLDDIINWIKRKHM